MELSYEVGFLAGVDHPADALDERFPGNSCTFYRQDESRATAYDYVDRP